MATSSEANSTLPAADPRPTSLRLRLLALAALSIAATLTVAGLSFGYIFEDHVERLVEQELEVRWRELAGAVALGADHQPTLTHDLTDPRYQLPGSGAYWRIAEGDTVWMRSRSLWDEDLGPTETVHLSPTGKAIERRGPNDSTVYMMEREVRFDGDGDATPRVFRLAVALDTAPTEALRRSFVTDVAIALGLIGLVLFAGAWLQASVGLSPLRRLRGELALVHRGAKSRLAGSFPSEVAPLASDLNRLLDRQEQLVDKARERAGDLAHGFKTPLTILQGEARRLEARGELESGALLKQQVQSMRRHVDRELARARTVGATAGAGTLTDARRSVDRLIDLVGRMPRGDGIVWDNQVDAALRPRMDPDDFGEVMGNLLDNARKWAKSQVRVECQMRAGAAQFIVDDDGPGAPETMRATLPRRGEAASGEDDESTGLGLAIVADVLAQYGSTLALEDSPSGGCRARFAAPT
jgi:signal transduction histidine kinase